VKQSWLEYVKWLRRAANAGDAIAQYNLGSANRRGLGVATNLDEAISWYHKASDQNLVPAMEALADLYFLDESATRDYVQALKWYRKAAEKGSAKAQNNLGVMYQAGNGVHQSDVDAAKWYQRAAEQGLAKAQFTLAIAYSNGTGVERDRIKTAYWLVLAANSDLPVAKDTWDGFQHSPSALNSTEIADLEHMIVSYYARHPEITHTKSVLQAPQTARAN
jgi:hypothetical protein